MSLIDYSQFGGLLNAQQNTVLGPGMWAGATNNYATSAFTIKFEESPAAPQQAPATDDRRTKLLLLT